MGYSSSKDVLQREHGLYPVVFNNKIVDNPSGVLAALGGVIFPVEGNPGNRQTDYAIPFRKLEPGMYFCMNPVRLKSAKIEGPDSDLEVLAECLFEDEIGEHCFMSEIGGAPSGGLNIFNISSIYMIGRLKQPNLAEVIEYGRSMSVQRPMRKQM